MFDVGQKVICVRREAWHCKNVPGESSGPAYLAECTVGRFVPEGTVFTAINAVAGEDGLMLFEWPTAVYPAICFRPQEPNIEALRSLVTKLPAKQPEEIAYRELAERMKALPLLSSKD